MRLETKKAFITGAGSGIGASIATHFAQEGADVAVNDLDLGRTGATVQQVERIGGRAVAVPADVSDGGAVRDAVARAREQLGRLDIIVHCAGIAPTVAFHEMDFAQWDRMLQVHLYGLYHVARAAIEPLRGQRSGRIIAISSVAGITGDALLVHYSAAKAGMIGFCKALARETAPLGITVNAIAPGIVDTPILGEVSELVKQRYQPPIGRLGRPSDIAAAAVYLASEEAEFVTGQVLSPNGGALT